MRRKDARPGLRVMVSQGAGLDSGKTGIILASRPPTNHRYIPIYPGYYQPFDPAREAHIQYDTGERGTMFYACLRTGK
jgi:hypothetical protein